MKLFISCLECSFSSLERDGISKTYNSFEPIAESGLYEIECPLGHKSIFSAQGLKFEFLFDLGFHAIADGYYREAITSFTSSLERFYEFYIQVISLKYEIPVAEFQESWKPLSKLSERQLGAFVVSYLMENKTSPILPSNKKVEFRNNVIHKGFMPNKQQAIDYGKYISELILPVLQKLMRNDYDFVGKVIFQQMPIPNPESNSKKVSGGATYFLTTAVIDAEDKERDYERYLSHIENMVKTARLFPKGFWSFANREGRVFKEIPIK